MEIREGQTVAGAGRRATRRAALAPWESSARRCGSWRLCGIALMIAGAVWGCSARQAYDGLQQGRRNECLRLPQSQQSQCLKQANISFEEYERQRREAVAPR